MSIEHTKSESVSPRAHQNGVSTAPPSERSNSATSPSTATPMPLANGLQPLSCLRCAHRKVKCDRLNPCTNCTKHAVPCEFPPPKTEKRKRRKDPHPSSASQDLLAKVERYEGLLKGLGVDVGSGEVPGGEAKTSTKQEDSCAIKNPGEDGRLFVNGKRSGYIQGNLWTKIGEAFENPGNLLPDSSEDESDDEPNLQHRTSEYEVAGLLLGMSSRASKIQDVYPPPNDFSKYWQVFLDNVHPVTMILHAPSIHGPLAQASKGHGAAPRDVEVIWLCVTALCIVSLTDIECMQKFGQRRSTLLSRHRLAAELGLLNAKFLSSSNFAVLQAYAIYLLAVRSDADPRAFWNLTGIAKRNGQRLGLNQHAATNELSVFEQEMRKRLWFQCLMFDSIAAQTAGTHSVRDVPDVGPNFPPPSNINDSDLAPDMKEPPKERIGATDMMFCRLRFKIFNFMVRVNSGKNPWGVTAEVWHKRTTPSERPQREKIVEDTEKEVELELLRYCDLLDPVHYLTATVARLIICKMRFSILHPRQYGGLREMDKADRDSLFSTALKVIEYDNSAHSQPLIAGFLWHSHQHFQWSCLVHVLDDLKTRTHGDESDRAWEQIRLAYEFRPDLSLAKRPKLPLYSAVNRLAVTAWDAREKSAAERGTHLETPAFVVALRHQLEYADHKRQNSTQGTPSTSQFPDTPQTYTNYDPSQVNKRNFDAFPPISGEWPDFSGASTQGFDGVDWSIFDSLVTQDTFNNHFYSQTNGYPMFQPQPTQNWLMPNNAAI